MLTDINGFELLSEAEYKELLKQTGFFIQESQRSIFDETNRAAGVAVWHADSGRRADSGSDSQPFGKRNDLRIILQAQKKAADYSWAASGWSKEKYQYGLSILYPYIGLFIPLVNLKKQTNSQE